MGIRLEGWPAGVPRHRWQLILLAIEYYYRKAVGPGNCIWLTALLGTPRLAQPALLLT